MDVAFQNQDDFIRNCCTYRVPGGAVRRRGTLRKIKAEGDLPYPLADLCIDLSIDDPDDMGATVERLGRLAAEFLERRTGIVLIDSEYELRLDQWWIGDLQVQRSPLREITSIEYLTAKDTWVTVDAADYWDIPERNTFLVNLLDDFDRPSLWQTRNCVRINFTGGYNPEGQTGTGDDGLTLDPGMKMVWTMLTAHFYENRELFAADKVADVEMSAGSLLAAYKRFW